MTKRRKRWSAAAVLAVAVTAAVWFLDFGVYNWTYISPNDFHVTIGARCPGRFIVAWDWLVCLRRMPSGKWGPNWLAIWWRDGPADEPDTFHEFIVYEN